jgi:Flagellar transcriptional activator (FlhD)
MSDSYSTVSELNWMILQFVRESLLRDRLEALEAFHIDACLGDLLLELTPEQIRRIAFSKILLVGLRWRRFSVWHCLKEYAQGTAVALPQALIAAEAEVSSGYAA